MKIKHVLSIFALVLVLGAVVYMLVVTAHHEGPLITYYRIPEDAKDDPAKKLTITWLGPSWYAGAKEGTWVERFSEKTFNIEIKPLFLDGNASLTRRPLMYSGGEIPDVAYENNPITLQRYARQGFYCEVPRSLIKKYAPTYVKYMSEYTPAAWLYSCWNGKNFGVPTQWLWGRYSSCPLWRKDWLEKVGIHKMPETLDEVHDALWKFRHNDPDGNGKEDTYGTTVDMKAWFMTFGDIYGAYGLMPYDWSLDNNGQPVYDGIRPEMKEPLALLQQWFKEKLIDPDFVMDTENSTVTQKLINGKIGYIGHWGSGYDWTDLIDPTTTDNASRNSFKAMNPHGVLYPGPLPRGPHGQRGFRVWGGGGEIVCFGPDVAKHPEKLIRVLTMMEAETKDYELGMLATAGPRGMFWDFKNPKLGYAGGLKYLPPYTDSIQRTHQVLSLNTGGSNSKGFFAYTTTTPEISNKYANAKIIAYQKAFLPADLAMKDIFGKPDTLPSAGEYLNDLRELQTKVYTGIISNKLPLSAFDDFVKEWRRRGGDRMIAEAKVLQQEKLRIYREMGVPERLIK